MQPDIHAIQRDVLQIIYRSTSGITPQVLKKHIYKKYGLDKNQGQSIIRDLISEGKLAYLNCFGSSFIAESLHGPVRVSGRVILTPPGVSSRCGAEDIVILLASGASFGSGRHPTTRLALRGIENVLENEGTDMAISRQSSLLDIGTGSGILVLAGIQLGIQRGIGIDTDPCARFEARENVRHNGLESRIRIEDRLPDLNNCFTMVTANLRLPTIISMFSQIDQLTRKGSVAVLSGLKKNELLVLAKLYERHSFTLKWQETEGGWAAVVIEK